MPRSRRICSGLLSWQFMRMTICTDRPSNIELILSWNMDFLQSLKDRFQYFQLGHTSTLLFGDIFIKAVRDSPKNSVFSNPSHTFPFHVMSNCKSVILRQLFSQYNQNYPLAQVTYAKLRKTNVLFSQFIQVSSTRIILSHLLNRRKPLRMALNRISLRLSISPYNELSSLIPCWRYALLLWDYSKRLNVHRIL